MFDLGLFLRLEYDKDTHKMSNVPVVTPCCTIDNALYTLPVEKLRNEDLFADLKAQFGSGTFPSACHHCEKLEKTGGTSERVRNIIEKFTDDEFDNYLKVGGTHPHFQIQVKFSNVCNMACRVCNSTESTTYGLITNTSVGNSGDISDNEEQWNALLTQINQVIDRQYLRRAGTTKNNTVIINTVGGETMLNPGFYKLVDWLCKNNLANKVKLKITTALAVRFSDEILSQFAKFNKVYINASLDSINENFYYVRWPAKWSKIEENLDTLVEYKQEHNNLYFYVTPNWSINNIFYIEDFLDYWADHPLVDGIFNYHLYRPSCMKVESLPAEYRKNLTLLLEKSLTHPLFSKVNNTTTLYTFIQSILEYFKNTKAESANFDEFFRFNSGFDVRTNTTLSKYNSRLYELLNEKDIEKYNSYYKYHETTGKTKALKWYHHHD